MNKTILVLIEISCVVIIAGAGVIYWQSYHNPVNTARRQLHDKNPEVRVTAILTLSAIGDKESLPRIRQLFHDPDANVSISAAAFLADFGDQSALPELRQLLNSKDASLRARAINALRKLGDRESITPIKQFLNDEDALVRYRTIHYLAEITGPESIPEIKKLINDKDIHVSDAAEQLLVKLGVTTQEIQNNKDQAEAESFKAIADFYRKKFPNTSFQNIRVGAGFIDSESKDNIKYHIFVPNEIEQIYLFPYSDGFLRKQSAGAEPLEKNIADNLLQLKKGVLYSRAGATESYDGSPEIACIDYVTPYKYYLLDHPRKESIPAIKKLLKDPDKEVRDQAKQVLKTLGVTDKEIKEAKEEGK